MTKLLLLADLSDCDEIVEQFIISWPGLLIPYYTHNSYILNSNLTLSKAITLIYNTTICKYLFFRIYHGKIFTSIYFCRQST